MTLGGNWPTSGEPGSGLGSPSGSLGAPWGPSLESLCASWLPLGPQGSFWDGFGIDFGCYRVDLEHDFGVIFGLFIALPVTCYSGYGKRG